MYISTYLYMHCAIFNLRNKRMKNYEDLTEEEKNLYGFEYFCNSCYNYGTDTCPFHHIGVVTPNTLWREEDGGLGCNKYWD